MNSYYEARDRRSYYKTIVRSLTGAQYPDISVLDLAAGGHCILEEVVRDRAKYLAVEIRKGNAETLQKQLYGFSADTKVVQGDAVNFPDYIDDREFDVIFVAGLLYHLSIPDQVKLLERVVYRAKRGAVLCTVFSHEKMNTTPTYYAHDGYVLEARTYYEHTQTDSDDHIALRIRASYQRAGERYPSCVLTEDSLVRLMRKQGCKLVLKYAMSPMIGDVPPVAPPNTDNDTKPFTSLMNNERGTVVIPLGPDLLQNRHPSGTMVDISRDSDEPLNQEELDALRDNVRIHLGQNCGKTLEAAHQAAHMIPLSLHHNIILGAMDAGLPVSEILDLRVYLESYLRVCNDKRQEEASSTLAAYHGYLSKESAALGKSLLETVKNYLWQHLPPTVRDSVDQLGQ
jgi:hypothetical protein